MESKQPISNNLITAVFESNGINDFYKQIHKTIDEMDNKVQEVVKKHEGQFLLAYRNHIKKLKKQLGEIKQKSEDQEKMFSSNDRIQYLQKQNIIFRQQALKLYDLLEIKTQELEICKNKIKQSQKEFQAQEKEAKQGIKISKMNEATRNVYQTTIRQLQEQLAQKDQQISRLKINSKNPSQKMTLTDGFQVNLAKPRSKLQSLQKPTKGIAVYSGNVHESQLKEWFLTCIRTVKREVAQRKTYSTNPIGDLNYIGSIEEFKMVDKLRLLQIFLQNEKLLVWMYEKIFPDRLSEITKYLSQHQDKEKTDKVPVSQDNESSRSSKKNQANILPEVQRPSKKIEARNKIQIRNGKLNLSLL